MAKGLITGLALVASSFVPGALSLTISSTSTSASSQPSVQCSPATGYADIVNPSFEDGTSGWSYSFTAATTTTTQFATNGSNSLYLPGQKTYWYVSQTVSGLQIGTTYTASVDVLPYMNPSYSIQEECNIYLYHTTLADANLIAYKTGEFGKTNDAWFTLSGAWTPTAE
ncbi:hypothetical protein F66182_16350, partial [Fusarium sp. NRRL 66182]